MQSCLCTARPLGAPLSLKMVARRRSPVLHTQHCFRMLYQKLMPSHRGDGRTIDIIGCAGNVCLRANLEICLCFSEPKLRVCVRAHWSLQCITYVSEFLHLGVTLAHAEQSSDLEWDRRHAPHPHVQEDLLLWGRVLDLDHCCTEPYGE